MNFKVTRKRLLYKSQLNTSPMRCEQRLSSERQILSFLRIFHAQGNVYECVKSKP